MATRIERPAPADLDTVIQASELSDTELTRAMSFSRLLPPKLTRKDLKEAAHSLTRKEVRYLVDSYYSLQKFRISASNQVRALEASNEPHLTVLWLGGLIEHGEATIKVVMDEWTMVEPTEMGRWARSIVGVGPVLAAGLLAHLDIERAPTVGHWWSFAGLNPAAVRIPHTKRTYNADLKTLCYKIGESFVKTKGNAKSFYGPLYDQRKATEIAHNEAGDYAEQARSILATKNFRDETKAKASYEQGILPPGHIHARARRWVVKLFLAHYHDVAYRQHYGTAPPLPYPIAHLGHAHVIAPPAQQ